MIFADNKDSYLNVLSYDDVLYFYLFLPQYIFIIEESKEQGKLELDLPIYLEYRYYLVGTQLDDS